MPSNTPGIKNGTHNATPSGKRQAINPMITHRVAVIVANEIELVIADCPAATAPGNSVHVRCVVPSCNSGKPTAKAEITMVTIAQPRNHPAPICCRNNLGGTGPSTRGQAISLRRNQTSSNNGATTIGQLISSAASELNVVLKLTQTSAGKTFTCKIAGTAKLFSASTNVRTAAAVKAPRASGNNNPRTSVQPFRAMSLSNWAASSRCHEPRTASIVIGHSSSAKIQTVPGRV